MGHLFWIYFSLGALTSVLCQTSTHREVTAVVGNTALLPCSVDFYGDQQVIWKDQKSMILTINDQLLIDDKRFSVLRPYVREWNLQIKHVRTADQGTYTCIVNSTPNKNKHVTLIVWYPPSISDSSPSIVGAEVGDDVTLKCNATGFPSPTIRWYKVSMTGDRQEIGRNKTFVTFTNITHEDAGTYECEADNGVSPVDMKNIKIDIRFAPEIRLPYEKISQEIAKDTLLECIVEANPISDQYWEKDGKRLENSDKYKIHDWDLGGYTKTLGVYITGLTRDDYGEYRCIALNDLGTVEDTVYLYEWRTGELRVSNTPHDVISRSGTSAQFNCTVEGLSSRETLTWWHHNPHTGFLKLYASNPSLSKQLPYYLDSKKYEIKGRYNLVVRDIGISDSGTYTCDISGYENYTATLTVVDSLTCNSNGTVHQGEPVVVSCEMTYSGANAIDWRHSWQHSQRKLSGIITEELGSSLSHVAFPATLSDSGVYKCTMSHRSPDFSDSCETRLSVRADGGAAQPVCRDGKPGRDVTMIMAIFGAGAALLFLLFCCILIAVVVSYRRQLKKYRENPTKQHQGAMCMSDVDYNDHGLHLYNPRYVSQSSIGPLQEREPEHGDRCPDEGPSRSHGSGVLATTI